MNCPYCGSQTAEGATFCGNCGAMLEAPTSPAVSVPPTPAEEIASDAFPAPSPEIVTPPPALTPSFAPLATPAPKKRNTILIIIVVVILLLVCCCCLLFLTPFLLGPQILDILTQIEQGL